MTVDRNGPIRQESRLQMLGMIDSLMNDMHRNATGRVQVDVDQGVRAVLIFKQVRRLSWR